MALNQLIRRDPPFSGWQTRQVCAIISARDLTYHADGLLD